MDEYEVVEGRCPSQMLLVNRLRKAVDKWRSDGYPGASAVTHRLFTYWFEEDHLVNGEIFRFYFGQQCYFQPASADPAGVEVAVEYESNPAP